MSRMYELGSSLARAGGAAAGGLVPAVAQDFAFENVDYFKEHYWAYPLLMLALGGLLIWKGRGWGQPIGYGMVGAALYSGYRGYKEESSGAGNVMGRWADAGNVMLPGYQDAGALPPSRWNPYAQTYHHATQTYPYANAA